MEQTECKYEAAIAQAVLSGSWNDALKQHLETCVFCQGTVAVCESLHEVADQTLLPSSLPNARLIWMKAQVIRKQRQAAKLEWYSRLGLVACIIIGVVALLSWKSPLFGSLVGVPSNSASRSWFDLVTETLPFTATAALMMIMRFFSPERGRRRPII